MSALHLPFRVGRLLVVALLMVAAVAAGPAAASANATFAETVITEERGDVASIPIVLSGTDEATVVVEQSDGSFRATIAVVDRNGDGRVTLRFNTRLAGRLVEGENSFKIASEEDDATVRDETPAESLLAADVYDLTVNSGSPSTAYPDDEATLILKERWAESLSALTGPRELADDLTNPATIERHEREGTLETGPSLRDDLLVVHLEASGMEGALAARDPRQNVTERLFEVLEGEEANLTIEQTNPSPELPAKVLLWNDTATTRVVTDAPNDTYYLVVDVAQVRVDTTSFHGEPSASWQDLGRGEEFKAMFSYHVDPSVWSADDQPGTITSDPVSVERREADLDVVRSDGWLFFEPTANRTATGWTNVRTGETLTVHLASENRIDRTKTVAVHEGSGQNRFEATFNLGDVPDGTNVSVDVRYENRSLLYEPVPGRIVQTSASVQIVEVDTAGAYYSVEANASTSHGGFVLLREGTTDGPRIGKSRHVSPGENSIVNVVLEDRLSGAHTIVAVAYRDVDADGYYDADDEPYRANGSLVADQIGASFPTPTESPPETSHVDPPTTTTERPSTTSNGQPGFEPLVTVLAILTLVGVAGGGGGGSAPPPQREPIQACRRTKSDSRASPSSSSSVGRPNPIRK